MSGISDESARKGIAALADLAAMGITDVAAAQEAIDRAREATGESWSQNGMTNFDHSIDDGLADDLKAGLRARHSAWNFNGQVWWDPDEQVFREEVWQYHAVVATRSALTLEDLMRVVNDEFGWD
jgi:hypothetical protein